MNKIQKHVGIIMQIEANEVHIWFADLSLPPGQIDALATLLDRAELDKAVRFRFDIHRERYIVARGLLRKILSLYLDEEAAAIAIHYDEHNKPYIHDTHINFNLSHSENMAIYAVANLHPVGVDIEVIRSDYKNDVAERFFSPEENAAISSLAEKDRTECFFQIWARKEAAIKATGKGFAIPSHEFSTIMHTIPQIIQLDGREWRLYPLHIHPQYASALAAGMQVNKISYWQYLESGPSLYKIDVL